MFQLQDVYPYQNHHVEQWSDDLMWWQKWFNARNIEFFVAVVPNKHAVYHDKLPNWVMHKRAAIVEKIIQSAKQKGANILDLLPTFAKKRAVTKDLLYHQFDSHWNQYGGSVAYDDIMVNLSTQIGLVFDVAEYEYKDAMTKASDLKKLLKLQNFPSKALEPVKKYVINNDTEVCQGRINKKTHDLEPCKIQKNRYFSIHRGPNYTFNEQALNHKKVLFLSDSFSAQNASLFNLTFSSVWRLHYNLFFGEDLAQFVEENQPEIVIYQIVERSLYKNQFIKARPSNTAN